MKAHWPALDAGGEVKLVRKIIEMAWGKALLNYVGRR